MTERVDIANAALTMVGADEIESFEDDNKRALLCKIHYPKSRDAVLERYDWHFASTRFTPAKLADAPDWGFANAFAVPPEILVVREVGNDWASIAVINNTSTEKRYPIAYSVEQRKILTDEPEIFARGTERIENEGLFTPNFVDALTAHLAAKLAYPLTESTTKVQAMIILYTGMIKDAKIADGQTGRLRRIRSSRLLRVR